MREPIETTIRLTPAQVSALECAGLDLEPLTPGERALRDAWSGPTLTLTPGAFEAVLDGLTDRCNAEDDAADAGVMGARGACTALCHLSRKLMRLRQERQRGDDDGVEYGHPREARR